MTQTLPTRSRGGWKQDEIDLLFAAVARANENGKPLRDAFESVSAELNRKPNSIRNFYYQCVRDSPDATGRQAALRSFTEEEIHRLIRQVLIGRGKGQSVRACVTEMAGGDKTGMLRYQNKYRSMLKNRPDLLMETAQELRLEGLPCPEDVLACRHYEKKKEKAESMLSELEQGMQDPCVRSMVEGLGELLKRARETEHERTEPTVPYQKWADVRREADRLKVENDLLKMELEDQKG